MEILNIQYIYSVLIQIKEQYWTLLTEYMYLKSLGLCQYMHHTEVGYISLQKVLTAQINGYEVLEHRALILKPYSLSVGYNHIPLTKFFTEEKQNQKQKKKLHNVNPSSITLLFGVDPRHSGLPMPTKNQNIFS